MCVAFVVKYCVMYLLRKTVNSVNVRVPLACVLHLYSVHLCAIVMQCVILAAPSMCALNGRRVGEEDQSQLATILVVLPRR